MKKFVCENNSSGTNSTFMVKDCLAKLFTETHIARQRVWEDQLSGTKPSDKATDCLEELFWTIDWEMK